MILKKYYPINQTGNRIKTVSKFKRHKKDKKRGCKT
jgi:hypothetical protein